MRQTTLAKRMSGGLLAALLAVCAAAPGARQAKEVDFAELDKAVEAELKAGHTPGAAPSNTSLWASTRPDARGSRTSHAERCL